MSYAIKRAETDEEIRACLDLRLKVFVQEQGVSLAEECDGLDGESIHVLALAGNVPVGAARFREIGDTVKIQRVCVLPAHRGGGVGAQIIRFILDDAATRGTATQAFLAAQTPAVAFYHKLGFREEGDEFLDAGMPHVNMRAPLARRER